MVPYRWIAGGIALTRDKREREMKWDDKTTRGAKGDETTGEGHETMGRWNDEGGGTNNNQHLPPPPWATAHRVYMGCEGQSGHQTTCLRAAAHRVVCGCWWWGGKERHSQLLHSKEPTIVGLLRCRSCCGQGGSCHPWTLWVTRKTNGGNRTPTCMGMVFAGVGTGWQKKPGGHPCHALSGSS